MTDQLHQPTTVYTGAIQCVERDCAEYLTADGYDNETVENCSHLTARQVCEECSPYDDDAGFIVTAVAWPCPHAA